MGTLLASAAAEPAWGKRWSYRTPSLSCCRESRTFQIGQFTSKRTDYPVLRVIFIERSSLHYYWPRLPFSRVHMLISVRSMVPFNLDLRPDHTCMHIRSTPQSFVHSPESYHYQHNPCTTERYYTLSGSCRSTGLKLICKVSRVDWPIWRFLELWPTISWRCGGWRSDGLDRYWTWLVYAWMLLVNYNGIVMVCFFESLVNRVSVTT